MTIMLTMPFKKQKKGDRLKKAGRGREEGDWRVINMSTIQPEPWHFSKAKFLSKVDGTTSRSKLFTAQTQLPAIYHLSFRPPLPRSLSFSYHLHVFFSFSLLVYMTVTYSHLLLWRVRNDLKQRQILTDRESTTNQSVSHASSPSFPISLYFPSPTLC